MAIRRQARAAGHTTARNRALSGRTGRFASKTSDSCASYPPTERINVSSHSTPLATRTDLKGRSLISMRHHTPAEIELLLDVADELRTTKRARVFNRYLRDRNFALIFLKPSLRTRVSFVVAASDEGAHLEIFPAEDVRFGIKESVKDIARVLGRVFDGIAFRGYDDDILQTLVAHAGIPVWNGLSDRYHPTQVLADLLTMRDAFGSLSGLPVTYVGDGRNNQARSLAIAAVKMGLDLRILSPVELQPQSSELDAIRSDEQALDGTVTITADIQAALEGSAVVYGDVWVSMGEERAIAERIKLLAPYRVTASMMALTGRKDTIYLHCLPALHDLETDFAREHPGIQEVEDEVFESAQSRVFDQAENRMHTAKALMVLTAG
jgi:ornithine carbamoyltransferase